MLSSGLSSCTWLTDDLTHLKRCNPGCVAEVIDETVNQKLFQVQYCTADVAAIIYAASMRHLDDHLALLVYMTSATSSGAI